MGSGSLWGIPLNFEADVMVYNKRLLEEKNLQVPTTTEELTKACEALQNHSGNGTYAFACRGSLSWATLITAYQSFYTTYGGTDFDLGADGKMVSTVNRPEGVEATEWFVDLVKKGGSSTWASTTYAEAVGDVGAGTAAICVDASGSCLSVCLENASEENKAMYEDGETDASLREGAYHSSIPSVMADWLYEDGRGEGDLAVLKDADSNQYYVVEFVKRYYDEADDGNISNTISSERVLEYIENIMESYTVTDQKGKLKYLTIEDAVES